MNIFGGSLKNEQLEVGRKGLLSRGPGEACAGCVEGTVQFGWGAGPGKVAGQVAKKALGPEERP